MILDTLSEIKERALHRLSGRSEHPLLSRVREYFRHFDQDVPLSECSFTVIDCELTGLSSREDEIVSLGAVRIRGTAIVPTETFYTVVQPRRLPKTSTLIHGITPSEVQNAPRLREVLPDFVEFVGKTFIVGHNIGLDMSFLARACRTVLGGTMQNPCIDTMRLARVYEEERWENYYDQFNLRVSYNLQDLAEQFGLPVFEAHNAYCDAMQTAYLFLLLLKKLRSGGIETLRDLYQAGRSWRWYF